VSSAVVVAVHQAVLLNLLTRNYLLFNMTDQASKLISRASFPESISNSQFVRHLYYKGKACAQCWRAASRVGVIPR
jgi:hypothetical protein